MERKVFKLRVKDFTDTGQLTGLLAAFNNVDLQRDVVERGAFKKTLKEKRVFPLLWHHNAGAPDLIVGTFTGEEVEDGLLIRADFFDDEESQKVRNKTRKLVERGVRVGLSMGYVTVKDRNELGSDGYPIRKLKEVGINEGSITIIPANERALVEEVKSGDKTEWTVAFINSLPDAAFAVIEPAYRNGDTEDKRARHLPHHKRSVSGPDDDDSVDLPHLRNALARASQITPVTDSISATELRNRAIKHLTGHAKRLEVGGAAKGFEYEMKPYPNEHACRLKDPGAYVRFARMEREHEGKTYYAVIGFKRDGGSEEQSYRYPKDEWAEAEARKHCEKHGGRFEPASNKAIYVKCLACQEALEIELPGETTIRDEPPALSESSKSLLMELQAELKKFNGGEK